MAFAPLYLLERFFYRAFVFFRHWYGRSPILYFNFIFNRLERLDYYLAWRITLKNIFQPLYKDYSVIGYILGFVFRSFRFLVASLIYGIIFIFAIAIYLFWLAIPPLLLYKTFLN